MCKRNLKRLALNLQSSSSSSKEMMPATPVVMSNKVSDQRNTKHAQDMQECTSNIYQQGPACILPNLYLGAYYNALNATQLARHDITCVINVASEIDVVSLPQHIEYHHIKWTHNQLDLATSGFERAIALIRTAHNSHQTVMIHCQQGIERSAALVVAFLIKSTRCTKRINAKVDEDALAGQNWSFDRALNFVQEKAPKIRPNMELLYQLREYEQSIPMEQQHLYQTSVRAEKRHNIRNRTKRSESIACSKPSARSDAPLTSSTSLRSLNQAMYYQRPRSASVRDTSSSANLTFATTTSESSASSKQIDKQPLAIAALIIVLVALYQRECCPLYHTTNKCKSSNGNDTLKTAVDNSDSDGYNKNNRHLATQFLKPAFPIY
ncbi:uncharacterized protein ATC70_012478 [Mucor velutinosus]|uniref:protein-tyrosine-phosphatase n=1 Tax=Mucor velutinosus TaxID=708070 RepID=A0AAN7D5K8_9FUNG|nr:hypothetical protein ATC70_012478 [Mucor velutinosus]